jgi:subtilisin family serine protease
VGDFCNSTATGGAPRTTSPETYDDGFDGHGTHNASYAAGKVSGVAKDARVFSLRAQNIVRDGSNPDCGDRTADRALKWAVRWVTGHGRKPAVVNISFGGGDATVQQAILDSIAHGFVYVLSGNTGGDTQMTWGMSVPDKAIVVGGLHRDFTTPLAPQPVNYGPNVALFAPAEGLRGAGRGVEPEGMGGDDDYSIPTVCCGRRAGDSFAAPLVAGVAATYLEVHPHAQPDEVKRAIIAAATPNMVSNPGTAPNLLLYSAFTTVR